MSESRPSLSSLDRKLRYREILSNLSTIEDESTHDDRINFTSSALKEAQQLLADGGIEERVRHPGEGYLDSKVICSTSDQVVKCSLLVSGNANAYDKHALASHIRDHPDFWTFSFPKEIPPVVFLFGTFAPTPPEERPRRERRKVERQKVAERKEPENIDKLEKKDEGSEMVIRVRRFITKSYRNNGDKPLSYFHLVLDPDSFSRTVENIYYVSFLARDAVISVYVDDSVGLPFIKPKSNNSTPGEPHDENQFIVSVDISRWKELIEAFHIRTPMMLLKRS